MRRAADSDRAARTTWVTLASRGTSTRWTSGGKVDRGWSARTCFGNAIEGSAPSLRSRPTAERRMTSSPPGASSTSSSRNRPTTRRPSNTETSSSTTSATGTSPAPISSVRRRRVCRRTESDTGADRTNARTRSSAGAGGFPGPASKVCSCLTMTPRATNGASGWGSFTVQPSPVRYRNDAPQRASRRSSVSW